MAVAASLLSLLLLDNEARSLVSQESEVSSPLPERYSIVHNRPRRCSAGVRSGFNSRQPLIILRVPTPSPLAAVYYLAYDR